MNLSIHYNFGRLDWKAERATLCPCLLQSLLTRQHQDGGRPSSGARKLLELGPGVDGVVQERLAHHARQVKGSARDEQTQDVLWLRRAALRIKLDRGPADAVREGHLQWCSIECSYWKLYPPLQLLTVEKESSPTRYCVTLACL